VRKESESQTKFLQNEYVSLWRSYGFWELPTKEFSLLDFEQSERPTLESVRQKMESGCDCELCPNRKNLVFGSGSSSARLMLVGEAPAAEEDNQGLPFVGPAGQLLTKILEAMGLTREEVYLTNVVKCRPPQNRIPSPDEIAACTPFLEEQIRAVAPEIIVALGTTAFSTLVEDDSPLTELRGQMQTLAWDGKTPVMPTFHPAYLLKHPEAKKLVWEDMKAVMAFLGDKK
jgi:uracil-DNA glycosylase